MKDSDFELRNFALEVRRNFGSVLYLTVFFPSALGNKAVSAHTQMRKYTLTVTLQGTKELVWIKV